MAISTERQQELQQIYRDLKVRVIRIDEKYSLEYVEPELDMPDSLNLTKLEYTPKSDEELTNLAEEQVASYVVSKQAALDKNYFTKIYNLYRRIYKVEQNMDKSKIVATDAYQKELSDIYNRIVNNGLIFSSLQNRYNNQALNDYKKNVERIDTDAQRDFTLLYQEEQDIEDVYSKDKKYLAQEKAARITAAYNKLVSEEEKLERSIEKYNTSLDEKEAKYQASRARAYEYARRAAHNRAIENSKLYLEIGETGYRRLIEKEKYAVCQDTFYTLTREEAKVLLSIDSFLVAHLGTYYDAFVDWVDITLV